MQIPPDQNTRAEAMWRIISQRVDFRGKGVIDLGCGTGDFLWRASVAGAEFVHGIDIDPSKCKLEAIWLKGEGCLVETPRTSIDINRERTLSLGTGLHYDIALCFSVLPYLDDVPATLKWMSTNFPLCLIECQYAGDGPGLPQIGADRGMLQLLLSNGFNRAEPIGKTRVEGREYQGSPVYRTIWMCQTSQTKE